ncbi:MAG: hypothetical protein QY323_04960 [Patescibacteria group bacterium]|nr:MAG: hypothetical protein QY323_04960 [Patescibacteria group bacterium]
MRNDVHLDAGTRVINTKTGKLGTVEEPHWLIRGSMPREEITIAYDGEQGSSATPRRDIEYRGNGVHEAALVRFGHVALADYVPGTEIVHVAEQHRGTVVVDTHGRCGTDEVLVRLHGCDGDPMAVDWRAIRPFMGDK